MSSMTRLESTFAPKCVFTRDLLPALRGLFNLEITANRCAAFFPDS